MAITEVTSSKFSSNFLILIRNKLRDNIQDPIIRPKEERFVLTSYPRNPVKYPIITVTDTGHNQEGKLGMGSQGTILRLGIEVRMWARNTKERDELFDEVYDYLRTNQIEGDDLVESNLHDFTMTSVVNVSEDDVQSKVMEATYMFLCA